MAVIFFIFPYPPSFFHIEHIISLILHVSNTSEIVQKNNLFGFLYTYLYHMVNFKFMDSEFRIFSDNIKINRGLVR